MAKQTTRKTYAPGYKQCAACKVYVLGTRSKQCPDCGAEFVLKAKPKGTVQPVSKGTALVDEANTQAAIHFAKQVGSIDEAIEQLGRLKALKLLVSDL